MSRKSQLDQLNRLVHLIADDNELLSRASTFVQTLVDSRVTVHGHRDLSAELQKKERKNKQKKENQ